MLSRIKNLFCGRSRRRSRRSTVARRRRLLFEPLNSRLVLAATIVGGMMLPAVEMPVAQPQDAAAMTQMSLSDLQWQVSVGVGVAEGEAAAPPYATGVFYPDTDGSGTVEPLDVLLGVNRLNGVGSRMVDIFADAPYWYDASGDGYHSPLDELVKINYLNQFGPGPFPQPPLINLPPRGQDMVIPMQEQSSMAVAAPFLDPEQLPMDFWVIDGPEHGTITQNVPNGNVFVYRPEYGFFDGTDYVIIEAMDSGATTATARVEFQVSFDPSLPHPPIAVDDHVQTYEDTQTGIRPLENDRSFHGGLDIVNFTQTGHGQLDFISGWPPNPDMFLYVPDVDYLGTDTFTYTVRDEQGQEDTASVVIEVVTNQPPVPSNPVFHTTEDQQVHFVAPDDLGTDPDGVPFVNSVVSYPHDGGIYWQPRNDGSGKVDYTYTPDVDFVGTDSFSYELWDLYGNSAVGTATFVVEPDLFEGPYLTRSEVVYSLVEVYAGGVIIDHTGVQSYTDVPSTYWAWAHWEELSSEGWDDSGFAVGTEAYPERPVTYGEIVLLGEILNGLPYANGMHLATAEDLCWVTHDEANRPADAVTTQRGLAIMAVMGEETACGLTPADVDLLVQDFLQQIHQ